MVHKSALWRTFRLAAAAVLTAPEAWQNILFSTLGKKWVQVTYNQVRTTNNSSHKK